METPAKNKGGRAVGTVLPITRRQREAAYLLGCGLSAREVREKVGTTQASLSRWLLREDFRAIRDEAMSRFADQLAARSMKLMEQQVEGAIEAPENIGRGYLGQQAAGRVMQHVQTAHAKEQVAQVVVTFASVPAPGMPSATDDPEDTSPETPV